MPRTMDTERIPQPVRAGVGLVATGIERARHIDLTDLATIPVRGLGLIATARERAERTYQALTNRGEEVVERWRGHDGTTRTASPHGTATRTAPIPARLAPEPAPVDIGDATPGATLAHDELPLDDFDHLTLGALRARLPKLDVVALTQLRDYERVHANRLPVLTMLDNRIAKVTAT